jgi:predicted DNA-binding protein
MKLFNLMLPEDLLERLKALSKKTGAPVAELVRRAIEAFLKNSK